MTVSGLEKTISLKNWFKRKLLQKAADFSTGRSLMNAECFPKRKRLIVMSNMPRPRRSLSQYPKIS